MSKVEKEIVYIAQLKGSLELSSEGVWIHNGTPYQNEKLSEMFSRSIIWDEKGGEYLVEIGNQRATFTCHDTAYFVRSIDDNGKDWVLQLSDGTSETLSPTSLEIGANDAIYCIVHQTHKAKFLKSAHQMLAKYVASDNTLNINGQIITLKL